MLCCEVIGCGHARLASIVNYSSEVLQEECIPEKKAQMIIFTEVVASQLL